MERQKGNSLVSICPLKAVRLSIIWIHTLLWSRGKIGIEDTCLHTHGSTPILYDKCIFLQSLWLSWRRYLLPFQQGLTLSKSLLLTYPCPFPPLLLPLPSIPFHLLLLFSAHLPRSDSYKVQTFIQFAFCSPHHQFSKPVPFPEFLFY